MIWELWRVSRPELAIRLSGTIGFIWLLSWANNNLAARIMPDAASPMIRGIAVGFLLFTSIISQTWLGEFDSQTGGFCFRLGFIRPVSTGVLFLVPMAFCVAAAVASYVIPAVLLGWLIQIPMPLAGPSLIIAVAVAMILSVVWSIPNRAEKAVVLLTIAAAAIWLKSRRLISGDINNPLLSQIGSPDFFSPDVGTSLAAVIVVAVACLLAVSGIDRQRHGDFPSLIDGLSAALSRSSCGPTDNAVQWKPFPHPIAAQLWYEWRRFGKTVLLLGIAAPLLILVFLFFVRRTDPGWTYDVRVWLWALLICPIVYQLVGLDGAVELSRIQGTAKLSVFNTTRSLTNDQLITIKVLFVTTSSFAAWLIMLTAAFLQTQISGNWDRWQAIGNHILPAIQDMPWSWRIAGLTSVMLSFASTSSLLLCLGLWMADCQGRVLAAGILLYSHIPILIWDAKHEWAFRSWWAVYCYLIAITAVTISILLLRKAIVCRSLSPRLFAMVFGMWMISIWATAATAWKIIPELPFQVPVFLLVLAGSMLPVPLASAAMAPLVYASYRHQ